MRINTPPEMPSDVRRPTSEVRRSTFDLRPSTFDLRPLRRMTALQGSAETRSFASSSPSILRIKRDSGSRDATLYLTAHHAHRSEIFLVSLCRDPACHTPRAYSIECW